MRKSADITLKHRAMEMEEHKDGETSRFFSLSYLRAILPILLTCISFLSLNFTPIVPQLQAQETIWWEQDKPNRVSKVKAKAKFGFGYDNNVSERKEDRLESRFYQFYASSSMYMLPCERTLLSLRLQNGLKHLSSSSLSGESVLINGLNLCLSHGLSERLTSEILTEVRGRTSIHSEGGVLPSEEAYLRGSVGAALKAVLLADVTGRAFFQYRFTNFEDFDPFDRKSPQMGLRTDVRLLPNSTISFQYSREKTHYDKWSLISLDEQISRADMMDELSVFAQLYKYFLFDITYSYQNNKSDISGYSYRTNRFTLLMAKSLPQGLMFQLYALIRYKKYQSEPKEDISTQVDLEDDERSVLTAKMSKEINEKCSLEAQYDWRRSSSIQESDLYTKGVFSFSMSFHF